ncbi:MAG: FAD binding domain-containing protein, partial [Gaiellaceae bacterium]
MQSTDVLLPSSVEELTAVFGEGGDVTVLAGGTILMPEIAAGRLLPGRTILLAHAGLDELALDGDPIRIGATVPIAALTGAPDSALAEAAATIADAEIRAQGTIGGNLCAP